MKSLISAVNEAVFFISTPVSTGSGFYLSQYDIIVTNYHVVKGCKQVAIDALSTDISTADIVFIDTNLDIAFLKPVVPYPSIAPLNLDTLFSPTEGDKVIALGHPHGLKYTSTQGIISRTNRLYNNTKYIQIDAAINPGNSGGPLVNTQGQIIGVNTFIIRNSNNLGFALPVFYLNDLLSNYFKDGLVYDQASKCSSCENINYDKSTDKYCTSCGSEITLIKNFVPFTPTGVSKIIESIFLALEYAPILLRRGPFTWEIKRGSASILITYQETSGIVECISYLCSLPKSGIDELYLYLLKENAKSNNFSFATSGQDIVLRYVIFDQYLTVASGTTQFKQLFDLADYYDDILVNEYGALWRNLELD